MTDDEVRTAFEAAIEEMRPGVALVAAALSGYSNTWGQYVRGVPGSSPGSGEPNRRLPLLISKYHTRHLKRRLGILFAEAGVDINSDVRGGQQAAKRARRR